jgi:hypothetical protein
VKQKEELCTSETFNCEEPVDSDNIEITFGQYVFAVEPGTGSVSFIAFGHYHV